MGDTVAVSTPVQFMVLRDVLIEYPASLSWVYCRYVTLHDASMQERQSFVVREAKNNFEIGHIVPEAQVGGPIAILQGT